MAETNDANNPAEKLERSKKLTVYAFRIPTTKIRKLCADEIQEKLSYREISKNGLTEGNVGYKLHHDKRLGR